MLLVRRQLPALLGGELLQVQGRNIELLLQPRDQGGGLGGGGLAIELRQIPVALLHGGIDAAALRPQHLLEGGGLRIAPLLQQGGGNSLGLLGGLIQGGLEGRHVLRCLGLALVAQGLGNPLGGACL